MQILHAGCIDSSASAWTHALRGCMAPAFLQRQPPALIARVTADPQRHCSSYHTHPAVLDATLHLAAAAAPASGSGRGAAPTHVPVGAAAVVGLGVGARGGALYPTAHPLALELDGSAACDYRLAGQAGATVDIQGLITRALVTAVLQQAAAGVESASPYRQGRTAPAAGGSAAERALQAASSPGNLLYEPQWQARSPLQPRTAPHAAAVRVDLAGSWRPRRSQQGSSSSLPRLPAKADMEIRFIKGTPAAALPVGVVLARALEAWQSATPALSGGSARLLTVGAAPAAAPQAPHARVGAAAGGALWALLRVAASEYPGIRVSGSNLSALAASDCRSGATCKKCRSMAAPEAAGAFGSSAADGVQSVARLLRSALRVSPPDCHVMPCPRGALADLRLVPQLRTVPGAGEVKVRNNRHYTTEAC